MLALLTAPAVEADPTEPAQPAGDETSQEATPSEPTSPTPGDEDTASGPTEGTSESSEPSESEDPTEAPSPSVSSSSATEPEPTRDPAAPTTPPKAAVVPQLVPPATGNNAVISVKVAGDRTGTSGVTSLAGVQLGLYATAGAASPVNNTWAVCTSDADGDCSFIVPNTQGGGANRDDRFWVKQISAPAGWYTNPSLGAGDTVASNPYRFQTGTQLRAGQTYLSTEQFMEDTGNTNVLASQGIWQNSRTNPVFPAQCGINAALVLDLSNSLSDTNVTQLKNAANGFVDALTGTPSQVAVSTFASNAPAVVGQGIPLTPVSTTASAQTIKTRISAYNRPPSAQGGTNWDRGLGQIADSAVDYDVAIVITDGNPTQYGNPVQGPGNRTRFREVENGIYSANAVKADGTKMIAFGVGSGVTSAASGLNLRSISGQTLGSDYYQTANFDAAAAALRALALGTCEGSITVVKQIVPSGNAPGDVTGAQPASGWDFTGAGTAGQVTVDAPTTRTTGVTGAANFPLSFPGTTSGAVTLTETQQSGFTLMQVGGANAVCNRTDTGASLPVTNAGALGFRVTANSSYPVSCTVYNQAQRQNASVLLRKVWVVNGVTYAQDDRPPGFEAQGLIDGTNQGWGVPRTGFLEGDTVALNEDEVTFPAECTLDSQRLTDAGGAAVDLALPSSQTVAQGLNEYEITNTLTCETTLTLVKRVQGGAADPASWTLDAIAPTGAVAGPNGATGTAGATAPVTPNVTYPLAESGGNPNYIQLTNPNAVLVPGSTGSWDCQQIDDAGQVIPGFSDGINGGVTVPLGFHVRCAATNVTSVLNLVKQVVNDNGGTLGPDSWDLTATPQAPSTAPAQTVTGSAAGEQILVQPGVVHDLTETDIDGYELESLECEVDGNPPVPATSVVLPQGAAATCTFVNNDQPAQLTLVKEVVNDNGGTAVATDWTLSADGPTAITGATGSDEVTGAAVSAGDYDLSEAGGPAGYAAGDWDCGPADLTGSTVAVPLGGDVTCTIVNDDQAASLTLVKEVVNDNGGTAVATDWTLSADGPTAITGATGSDEVTGAAVSAGDYDLSEAGGPAGYTAGDWDCGDATLSGATVTVPLGGDVTCTIVNDDQAASLTLVKEVVNDNGGTAVATDWTLSAEGPTPITGATGTDAVTAAEVSAGDYDLSEAGGPAGYTAGDWDCGDADLDGATVTVPLGGDVTCTIVNDDAPGQLTLVKDVVNDNGGTAVATDWTLSADGPTPITGATGTDAVTAAEVSAGDYDLSEAGGPAGYTAGDWDCGPASLSGATVTVPPGGDVTCTIVNDDAPGQLTLVKEVVNDDGGTAAPGDWTLSADGPTPITGATGTDAVTAAEVSAGDYDLSEAGGPAGYTAGDWDCGPASLTGSTVTVPLGGDVTCTIVNDDDPGQLTLVKEVDNTEGGTAVPADWTLSADGPTPITGVTGADEVTSATVDAGAYTLSESGSPEGYVASDWDCGDATVSEGELTMPLGGDVTCTIVNTYNAPIPGSWTVFKSSDPASGSTVDPGDVITYTVTASSLTDEESTDVVVTDNLAKVLNNASLVEGSITASTGTATISDTTLTWNIPVLAGDETVTYQVKVDDDAFGVRLLNVVTSPGSEPCVPETSSRRAAAQEECDRTRHKTPKEPVEPVEPNDPDLPDTGGPQSWLAVVGVLLSLLGAGIVLITRRRGRRA